LVQASETLPTPPTEITVVQGLDYFNNTIKAIEMLGGIEKFVSPGDKVGLLANSAFKKSGTYTRPDIMLAVAFLCKEAGAREVYSVKGEKDKYWRRSPLSEKHQTLIKSLKPDHTDHITVKNPNGKLRKELDIKKGVMEYDKLINLPIVKDHNATNFTCNLKNMMGVSSITTNLQFHFGRQYIRTIIKELGDWWNDIAVFSQSVADLNTARRVDLSVTDATEFISTNGPSGPGKIERLHKIVAGANPVTVDALCCTYLGLQPSEVGMIKKAHESGLGEMNLQNVIISEVKT